MKFLIAGSGSIGRRHLRNLLALGQKDIVLYRTGRSTLSDDQLLDGRSLAEFPAFTDLRQALQQGVQAVVVANPTSLHLATALPAAQAGCALLLEKPISHTLDGIDTLQAAVKQNRNQALVGFQFRFHPGLQKIRELLCDGAIGHPLSARAHWGEYLPGWHPWEDYRISYSARQELGGGVLLTLSHPLDYLGWLLGDVEQVSAMTSRQGELELAGVESLAEVTLRFASGALGSVHLDYNQQPSSHTLAIVGTQGMLHWDNATNDANLFRAGGAWEIFPAPAGFERNQMFLDEMRNFVQMAEGKASPACTLEDGIRALRIALAALESAETEKVIHLGPKNTL